MWKPTGQEIAVLCGDLHLTLKAPAARAEKDWLKVQERYLNQLYKIKEHFDESFDEDECDVIYTGDIFDTWNPPPELINFALIHLPLGLSVAGNHDLPNHDYDQLKRSGYGTLIEARKLINLRPGHFYPMRDWHVVGYPWGVKDVVAPRKGKRTLAVIHDYCWAEGHTHPGAAPENYYLEFMRRFHNYRTLAVGDNHSSFSSHKDWNATAKNRKPVLFNNGGFIRRRSDERDYRPRVGVLFNNGTVREVYLDTSEDQFQEVDESVESVGIDPGELLESVRSLADVGLDFKKAAAEWVRREKPLKKVEKFILKWLEEGEKE